jgi:hypothetical protein
VKYKIFLTLFLILVAGSGADAEKPVRYRVELIVLRHLDATAAARLEPVLKDFSASVDLVPRELPEGATENAAAAGELISNDAALATLAEEPPPLVWVESPGDTMQETWRRLRQSANFRPELYFSWEQADADPLPQVRVHDGQLLYEHDPWAGQRAELPAPSNAMAADDAVPEPLRYYHIDGTARLRRSRFLHLELDIEWREPAASGESAAPALNEPETAPGSAPPPPANVHRILQSRTVRTDQVQYFDGPFIGVLALVTRIGPAAESTEETEETSAQP